MEKGIFTPQSSPREYSGNFFDRVQSIISGAISEIRAELFKAREPAVTVITGDHTVTDEDMIEFTGETATLKLPPANRISGRRGRALWIVNNGTGTLTIVPNGSDTVSGTTSVALPTLASAVYWPNGATKWRSVGGAFKATSLILSSILDVTGSVTLRGLSTYPGATTGSSTTVQLIGDLRNILFGTVNAVKIGVLTYTGGLNIGFTNGATEKIGFYGVSPIAQQILPTGAGKTVDDVITFLQLWGAVRQS